MIFSKITMMDDTRIISMLKIKSIIMIISTTAKYPFFRHKTKVLHHWLSRQSNIFLNFLYKYTNFHLEITIFGIIYNDINVLGSFCIRNVFNRQYGVIEISIEIDIWLENVNLIQIHKSAVWHDDLTNN